MTRDLIATATIFEINRRQDDLRGDGGTAATIERGWLEARREELAREFYGPVATIDEFRDMEST